MDENNKPVSSELLSNWETSYGASFGGIFVRYAIASILRQIEGAYSYGHSTTSSSSAGVILLIFIVCEALLIIYPLALYTSYFSENPKIKSSGAVSFLNCLAGGIIFGPLWNYNLTKENKGISYGVFVALQVAIIVFTFYLLSI